MSRITIKNEAGAILAIIHVTHKGIASCCGNALGTDIVVKETNGVKVDID
mgnify:CR=1 FL=1|tara:strand:+ start:3385 stop:3534 length:150 start_codon:yes stop_codon:yes gene_type:complete